jgi:hypothetical protein
MIAGSDDKGLVYTGTGLASVGLLLTLVSALGARVFEPDARERAYLELRQTIFVSEDDYYSSALQAIENHNQCIRDLCRQRPLK